MKSKSFRALKAAFPYTIPILAGFLFLGMTYGIYMNTSGFSFIYPLCMSALIFAGSMEFITVSLLLAPFNPLQVFLMTIAINARHLFYGISMLDRYDRMGWKKPYLVFGLCDETFSINYTANIPDGTDRGWFMMWVTVLNQFYWVAGATLGGIFGSFIKFNTEGLEFCMTAMFVVIFLDNWMKEKIHISSVMGLLASAASLVIFGPDNFIIPAMIVIVILLTAFRRPIEKRVGGDPE